MSEQTKALVGRWVDELWNKGNLAIVDELGVPEIHMYYPLSGELRGRDQVKKGVAEFRTVFPDAVFTPASDFIAEGEHVAARWKCEATHKGKYGSIPPTGRTVSWMGISIIRVVDGKIVDETGEEDALNLMRQLGAVPAMA
jgi:steroid delta-isomerase-like uncharacterized protein